MGSSPCMLEPLTTTKDAPLVMRQKLLIHAGGAAPERFNQMAEEFAQSKPWEVVKSTKKHTHREIRRVGSSG